MTGQHLAMGGGAEFDAIRRLLATWGSQASGVGDDAAIIGCPAGERLVVSTDASVEGIHFRREWMTAEEIGARAAAAALSDLAAMAASPRALLLSLVIPDSWQHAIEALGRGVGAVAEAAACPIVGGNLSAGGELSLTITVVGSAPALLTRAGARVGDAVYVTGVLGGPAAAVRAFQSGSNMMAAHLARFVAPVPRLREARWLAERGAHAAVDISDGLVSDAAHLARASGVSIEIDEASVPCIGGVTRKSALTSGEEYELLVAMPSDVQPDVASFHREFGLQLTRIGSVVARRDEPVLVAGTGANDLRGHDHLA